MDHETTRPDRDQYITIHWNKMQVDTFSFDKLYSTLLNSRLKWLTTTTGETNTYIYL